MTQNYQTTTILYYTFFLPGVLLHELVYWLAAGMLNVRASQTLKWPDAQEVGELKLNFVQLASRTDPYRKAIITAAPLVAGIALIWIIASTRLNMPLVVATLESGSADAVTNAAILLFNAPDFWLWAYVIFAIGNTMFPIHVKDLAPWRFIFGAIIAVISALFVIGLGAEIFEAASPTLAGLLAALQISVILVIGVDIVITAVLGTIEAIIERITGNSATFRNGKMMTMTLAEAQAERRKARERAQKQAQRQQKPSSQGLMSVYALSFPIPGSPGQEPITSLEPPAAATAPEVPADAPPPAPELPTTPETEEELAARITFSGLSTTPVDASPDVASSDSAEPPYDAPEDTDAAPDEAEGQRAAQILFRTAQPNDRWAQADEMPPTASESADKTTSNLDESEADDTNDAVLAPLTPAQTSPSVPHEAQNDAQNKDDGAAQSAQPATQRRPLRIMPFEAAPPEKTTPPKQRPHDLSARLRALEDKAGIEPARAEEPDNGEAQDKGMARTSSPAADGRTRFRTPQDEVATDNTLDEELPLAPHPAFDSLRARLAELQSAENPDTDDETPATAAPPRRMTISPFSIPTTRVDEDEDSEDEDESIRRRGRSEARNIFADLSLPSTETEDDDQDEAAASRPALPRLPRSRPVPKPTAKAQDEADEAGEDTEDPGEDDDIVYEDVEEYIPDDDNDISVDYDGD